jgi:hypothetical protein
VKVEVASLVAWKFPETLLVIGEACPPGSPSPPSLVRRLWPILNRGPLAPAVTKSSSFLQSVVQCVDCSGETSAVLSRLTFVCVRWIVI